MPNGKRRRVNGGGWKANLSSKDRKRRQLAVFGRDGWRCLRCGKREDLTLDHVIPLSKGGSNRIENLQTLCFDCNHKKADRLDG